MLAQRAVTKDRKRIRRKPNASYFSFYEILSTAVQQPKKILDWNSLGESGESRFVGKYFLSISATGKEEKREDAGG